MTAPETAEQANGNTRAKVDELSAETEAETAQDVADRDEKNRDRFAFALRILSGYQVRVKTTAGILYEGVYSGLDAEPDSGGLSISLKVARILEDSSKEGEQRVTKPQEKPVVISTPDIVYITAQNVRFGPADVGPLSAVDDAGGFGTDSAISRGRGGREGRELERWVPDESESAQFMHLEQSVQGGRDWDQFQLNERKFGVRTDYDEELYTTRLDPTKSRISVEEAARLAREIERGDKSNTNLHVLEERGVLLDDSQIDEEDRYGAVMRDVPAKIIPPPAPPQYPPSTSSSASSLSSAATSGGPNRAGGRAPPSAPIAMDTRRETNKVRMQMTAPKKTSPYGTPKSPLASPLVGNAQKLEALNLDPGVPRVDEKTRQEFEQFKAQTLAQAAATAAAQQVGGKQSMSLEEMRSFSQAVGTKLQRASDKKPSEVSTSGAEAASSSSGGATSPAPSSATKLNPFAKEFSFNVNAKEFNARPSPAATTPTQGGPRPPSFGTFGSAPRPTPPSGGEGPSGQDVRRTPNFGVDDGRGDGNFIRRPHDVHRGIRDDRRHHDGLRPPPPPPDAMHPPPPPPGGNKGPVGPQGPMQVPGMVPMMAPIMMMGPGGMPTGQAGFFMMPGGARPGGPVFMPAGGPSYMPGRPMMVPMMGPAGVPMPPAMMGVGGYNPGAYPPNGPGGMRQQHHHQQQHRQSGGGANGDHKDAE